MTAVAPVVIKGKGLWVGWSGIHMPEGQELEDIPESDPSDQTPTAGLKSDQVCHLSSQQELFLMALILNLGCPCEH